MLEKSFCFLDLRVTLALFAAALGAACEGGEIGSKPRRTDVVTVGEPGDAGEDPRGGGPCPAGAPVPVDRVRILPAQGRASALAGVRVQGSNSGPTNDFVDLATITEVPPEGAFAEVSFPNQRLYRYVKLYAPSGATLAVAELELYHGEQRITGSSFGTAAGEGTGFERALDGDPTTSFVSATTGGYVGLDVAGDAIAPAPRFAPRGGTYDEPPMVTLASDSPGTTIRYTVDGTNPSRTQGAEYSSPITPGSGRSTLKAVAYADCLFDSPVVSESYAIGPDARGAGRGLRTYHIGNSLTDTINPWLEPIADSTGVDHEYARWTIPGAPISWLRDHQGEGFANPAGASEIQSFAREFAPIDHVSVQPFSEVSLDTQGAAAVALLEPVIASSPDVQVWVYAQWPSQTLWRTNAFATGAGWANPPWSVPRAPETWEESTENQLLYHEAFRQHIDERLPGRPVRVVPGGSGLVRLKRAIDAGTVPGIGSFFAEHFDDDLHLSEKGQYLVALVFYACLYGKSPEGRVTHEGTGLTEEQARAYQGIAWEVASGYEDCGGAR